MRLSGCYQLPGGTINDKDLGTNLITYAGFTVYVRSYSFVLIGLHERDPLKICIFRNVQPQFLISRDAKRRYPSQGSICLLFIPYLLCK